MNCYAVLLQISICSVIVSEFAVCAKHFTDRWAVQILGGEAEAIKVAHEYGFTYVGEIMPDYYQLVHRKVAKRSVFPSTYYHSDLAKHPKVIWLEQQVAKKRVKRALRFNDPKWPQMWYLNRGRGIDMNVREAWMKGYTGKGVVVTILDDGIETDHPDLRKNFDEQASYDVNSQDPDPQPRYDYSDENRHGTRCAGEVAAEADNNFCSVGVAYDANIGGVRMLDGDVTDSVEAQSLGLNRQHIHIYSASWGPEDDGRTVDGPATLARKAFYDGITKGRGGLGSIFIWASGNGGPDKDSCNCDGYTNNIYTLSISSATENGNIPWYSEACSSTLATTYSSGSGGEKQIMTTDLHQGCTDQHTGTSASAPLAAGLCALALQANPLLTWRDMQHIVVMTAKPNKLIANDWVTTGVNRKVSHSFGYGLMDAAEMVRVARNWTTVPAQNTCEVRSHDRDRIPMNGKITVPLYVDGCEGSQNYVKYLEHVVAKITLKSSRRGDLQIYLTSPMGTKSTLLARRLHDTSTEGFNNWSFMTTHNWGEFARGTWILEIENGAILSEIREWTLVVMGTGEHPQARSHSEVPMVPRNSNQLPLCSGTTVTGLCIECSSGFYKMANKCVKECPIGWYGKMSEATSKSDSIVITPIKTSSNISLSLKAHFECGVCNAACESCRGAEDTDCFRCKDGYKMFEKKCTVEGFDLLGRHKYVLAAIVVGSVALVVFIAVCFIIQIRNRRSCRFLPHAEAGYKGKYRTLSSPGDQEAGDDSDDEICNKTELVA